MPLEVGSREDGESIIASVVGHSSGRFIPARVRQAVTHAHLLGTQFLVRSLNLSPVSPR